MNRINFEKQGQNIRIVRVENGKSFLLKPAIQKKLIVRAKASDVKGAFKIILDEANYLRALEIDAEAKKAGKCKNTMYDSRYRLLRFLVPDKKLQQYNKKDNLKKVSKAVKGIKAKAKSRVKAHK